MRAPSGTDAAVLAPMGRSGFRAPPDHPLHNLSPGVANPFRRDWLLRVRNAGAAVEPPIRSLSPEDVMLVRQIADSSWHGSHT